MGQLSHSKLEQVTSALLEFHSHPDFQTLPQYLIAVTRKLLPVDVFAYNEINGKTNDLQAVHDYPGEAERYFPAFAKHMHEHPNMAHVGRTGCASPLLLTDFVTQRQFERTALYNEFYRTFGIRHQLTLFMPLMSDFLVGVTCFRLRTAFTEEDRAVLKLLGPHIGLAWRNARALAQAQQPSPADSSSVWQAKIERVELGNDWRVRECSNMASTWVRRHFGVTLSPGRRAPQLFANWLTRITSPTPDDLLDSALNRSLISRGVTESLEISWMPESPLMSHLNVVCKTRVSFSKSAGQFGLTAREAQVLAWLMEGKTNPEIGAILGTSPNTVRKHLERIYAKLGVENRMAAMRILRDLV